MSPQVKQYASTFSDPSRFGSVITDVYRPVFENGAGRRAHVAPVTSPGERQFRAELTAFGLGDLVLSQVDVSGHEVDYHGTVDADESALKIYYVSSGTAVIRQDGREQTIEAGELGVHDSMAPYQIWTETGFDSLIMVLPKTRLLTLGRGYTDLSAARFTADDGAGRIVLPYLQGLTAGLDEVGSQHGRQVFRSTVDLLTTLFTSAVGVGTDRRTRRLRHQASISDWIDDHLLEDLNPGRIAAAHFMSVRSLHALFDDAELTVGGLIRHRRLERARELLLVQPGMSVTDVARFSGFRDPSYFGRAFRQEFGSSPTQFRAMGARQDE